MKKLLHLWKSCDMNNHLLKQIQACINILVSKKVFSSVQLYNHHCGIKAWFMTASYDTVQLVEYHLDNYKTNCKR